MIIKVVVAVVVIVVVVFKIVLNCSQSLVSKNLINVKQIAFGNKNKTHYWLENGSLGFIETLHKQ